MNKPPLKLLVTSREQLEVQAEWVFDGQGLVLPASAKTSALETSADALQETSTLIAELLQRYP